MPTCETPGCPGHLGKYPDCVAEALTELSMEGGDESTGDVDWGGYYTLLVLETDEDVTIDPDGEGRTVHVAAGAYILQAHTSGAMSYETHRHAPAAKLRFAVIDAEYGKYLDTDETGA